MKKLVFILVLLVTFSQCVYDDYNPSDTGTNATGDTNGNGDSNSNNDNSGNNSGSDNTSNKTTYLADVQPILNQLCVSCHGGANPTEGIDLSTYEKAKYYVNKVIEAMSKPANSDDIMPPSGKVDQSIINTIIKWKDDGLLEGQANSGGNTGGGNNSGTVTYANGIQNALTQNCTACHGNTNPSAGLSLTTYTQAKNNIDKILARIDLQNGQTGIMPPSGRMPDATIQLFKDWKTQGLLQQ
ncbi:MAG: hypothetical protein ACWA42_04385 [Lutibacter sp.]